MTTNVDGGPPEETYLSALDEETRADLRHRSRKQRYRPGTVLLYEGQSDAPVVFIVDGRVRVATLASDGRELVLAFRGPGAILGELAALDSGRCSASVTAIDHVHAITMRPADFRAFLQAQPNAAIALVRMLGHRLRDADRKRVEFAALDTPGRVAARLVELLDRFGHPQADGSVHIELALSQEELAGWVGSSREATVRALSQLRTLGLVETARRQIRVNDPVALRRRAAP